MELLKVEVRVHLLDRDDDGNVSRIMVSEPVDVFGGFQGVRDWAAGLEDAVASAKERA